MKTKTSTAFTLIEMLVVIAIIAVLAAFAVPALTSALTRGQMTGMLNNMHQLHLAGQQMALDGETNSDSTLGWPGDITPTVNALSVYCDKLISNNYLQAGDVKKILSAPGVNCTFSGGTTDPSTGAYTAISALTNPALKVYKVKSNNPSNTIFAESGNYTYNSPLLASGTPFGDKGFVVQRKGGDAALLRKAQAANSSGGSVTTFQATVGRIPGDDETTVGTEADTNRLTSN